MSDLERVTQIKTRVEDELLKLPGVTGVDVGPKIVGGRETDTLAIRVYVERKKTVSPERMIPKDIDGVPTDVIERKFELH